MKTPKKMETYFNMIENIKYENEYGGSYAYIQFMAYSREVLKLLRPLKSLERHMEAIEGTNWLLNEYLAVRFTYRHKTIFENKLSETRQIFNAIRESFKEAEIRTPYKYNVQHAQAA
ncbi:MAG: hypothetical protein H0U95_03200 [Bacteroidetes bacterium]|nr:hypothetical protein [Bacteroidota bacterium]